MGDNIESSQEELSSYTKVFEEQYPFFMAIGMTYDEYWNDDCWIAYYYLKSYRIKKEQKNEEFWLQGMYIYEALCDVAPILHAFSKKGVKPDKYSEKPYDIFPKTEKEEEKEVELERQKALEFFKTWSRNVANKINKEE